MVNYEKLVRVVQSHSREWLKPGVENEGTPPAVTFGHADVFSRAAGVVPASHKPH